MSIDPRRLSIADFTYELPAERIAIHPLADRDASKLLLYRNNRISDHVFRELPELVKPGSLLVFNSTRVVRARILMHRATGGLVEIFCTDASDPSKDFTRVLQETGSVEILAYVGNVRRWKEDEVLTMELANGELHAKKIAPVADQWKVQLNWTPSSFSFAAILEEIGNIPLPPYMHREEENEDAQRYQTIFANEPGSVAAPTASLHFTDAVMQKLKANSINTAFATLHVGAGTFKPVKSETMAGHDMHREKITVSRETLKTIIAHLNTDIIAAGTTALRTIESIYWFGRQLVLEPGQYRSSLFVGQWEPYENGPDVPVPVALKTIDDWMQEYNLTEFSGYTQIMIAPGYRFRIVKGLITNFHQPQSTLLLLVAAFAGDDYRRIYDHALTNGYRFLSYGDGSLLLRNV